MIVFLNMKRKELSSKRKISIYLSIYFVLLYISLYFLLLYIDIYIRTEEKM